MPSEDPFSAEALEELYNNYINFVLLQLVFNALHTLFNKLYKCIILRREKSRVMAVYIRARSFYFNEFHGGTNAFSAYKIY